MEIIFFVLSFINLLAFLNEVICLQFQDVLYKKHIQYIEVSFLRYFQKSTIIESTLKKR